MATSTRSKRVFVTTYVDLSNACGVSVVTLQKISKTTGYRKERNGDAYDVEFFRMEIQRRKENADASMKLNDLDTPGGDMRGHEVRYKKARADIEESKAAVLKGSLIDLNEVRQEQTSREMAFKKAFMNLPRNMATRLVGCGSKEIEAVLTKYVSEGFRKLVKKLQMPDRFTGESSREKKEEEGKKERPKKYKTKNNPDANI